MSSDSLHLGIDFGTSTNYITKWNSQKKRAEAVTGIISELGGKYFFDNLIYYETQTNKILGDLAYQKGILDPLNYVEAIKRHIEEDNWSQLIKTFNKELNCVEVATDIFSEIKKRVEKISGGTPVEHTVISVPFAFLNKERQRIKKAANDAGLNVIGLIEEPVAAAISYGLFRDTLAKNKKEKILIFDLGGGTFDVTIFELERIASDEIRVEVINTDGHKNLGGKDIDKILVDKMIEIAKYDLSAISNKHQRQKDMIALIREARRLKEALSESNEENFFVSNLDGGKVIDKDITRTDFDKYLKTNGILNKINNVLDESFNEVGMDQSEIDRIVLVGGSSYIPLIHDNLQKYFKKSPESIKNPGELVGEGAGIYCGSLIDKNLKYSIIRKISHSIGVKVGQEFEPFIGRNSKYEVFSPIKPFQIKPQMNKETYEKIPVYQGNSRDIKNCSKVGDIVYNRKDIVNNEISIQLGTDANGMVRYKLFRTNDSEPFKEGEIIEKEKNA